MHGEGLGQARGQYGHCTGGLPLTQLSILLTSAAKKVTPLRVRAAQIPNMAAWLDANPAMLGWRMAMDSFVESEGVHPFIRILRPPEPSQSGSSEPHKMTCLPQLHLVGQMNDQKQRKERRRDGCVNS